MTAFSGVLVLDEADRVLVGRGIAEDPSVKSFVMSDGWLDEARTRRVLTVQLAEKQLGAFVSTYAGGTLLAFSDLPGDTVARFLSSVDFAYDILHHILTDPFEALNVVDAAERLVYISPVHEAYMGLKPGESDGRHVSEVIDNTRLHHVVRTGIAEVGQVQRFKGYERVVSRYPIRHDSEIVGAIGRIMFKGPEQVEELSRRVNMLEEEVKKYRHEAAAQKADEQHLDSIVGDCPAIHSLKEQIRIIAPLDIPVLIQGESGTGKELVAQALHMLSGRVNGPMIAVNAAALPAELVESELFGFAPGSFTGADRKGRKGKFEQADKGTIFLDEIGDMPLTVQTKLLRVLQDKKVERIGESQPRSIDFRLCSATNRDLEEFVQQDRFRLDLFYRISPVIIQVPPLAERLEDIPLLVQHFLSEFAAQYERGLPEVHPEVYHYLISKDWPGNIRQLRQEIERAYVFLESDQLVVENFSQPGRAPAEDDESLSQEIERQVSEAVTLKDKLELVEDEVIREAMKKYAGNKKRVAEKLGISRSYLYKKLGLVSHSSSD